jgi:hypothetical protein
VAKEDKFLITRAKGVFGFTAKARRSGRDAEFFGVKRNAEMRRESWEVCML